MSILELNDLDVLVDRRQSTTSSSELLDLKVEGKAGINGKILS